MSEDLEKDSSNLDPIEFELVNGHRVRIATDWFWEQLSASEKQLGDTPNQYFAVRVYSSEGNLRGRMVRLHEFRPNHDFPEEHIEEVWDWLSDHVAGPACRDHDCLEDFVLSLAEVMTRTFGLEEDAVEHYKHLPELCDVEAFDHVDDSVFNDQNDSGASRLAP